MTEAFSEKTPVLVESQTTREDDPKSSVLVDDPDAGVVHQLAVQHFERLCRLTSEQLDVYDLPDDTGYVDMAPARRLTNGLLFTYDQAYMHATRITFERSVPQLRPRVAETSEAFKAAQSMAVQYATAPGTSWRNAGPMDSQAWMAFMAGTRPDMADLTKSWLAWPLAKAYVGRLTLEDVHPHLNNWSSYYDRSDFGGHWAHYRMIHGSAAFEVGFLTPAEYAAVLAGNRTLPDDWKDALAIPFPPQFTADDVLAAWVFACCGTLTPRVVLRNQADQEPDLIMNPVYYDSRFCMVQGDKVILVDTGQYSHGNQNVLANGFVARAIPVDAANSHAYERVAYYMEERATYDEKLAGALLASFVFGKYRGSALLYWIKVVAPDLSYLFARFAPVNVIVDSFDPSHTPRLLPFTMFRVANFAVELSLLRAYAYDEVRQGLFVTRQDYRCASATARYFNSLMGQFGITFGELVAMPPFDHCATLLTSPVAWFELTSTPLGPPDFHAMRPTRNVLLGAGWHYRRGKQVENPLDRVTQRAFAWAAAAAYDRVAMNAIIQRWSGAVYANLPVRGFIPVNAIGAYDQNGMCRPRPVVVPLSAGVVNEEEETLNNGLDVILTLTDAAYRSSLVSTTDGRPGTVYNCFVLVTPDPSSSKTQLSPVDGNYAFLGL